MFNKLQKWLIGIIIVQLFLILTLGRLQKFLELTWVQCLKVNLDFIGKFINRYPWLAAVFAAVGTIGILWFLLMRKFSLSSTKVTILGAEFELKQTEDKIKAQVKNYLSTKRSIFVFYKEYDNCYDCINSMYQILLFLREQLANFDSFSQTENESYKHIEGMVKEIGKFLTKYQSDYRRYYEVEKKRYENRFMPFKNIEGRYIKIRDMEADFLRLNHFMKPHAVFFGIDFSKWQNWYP